MVCGGIVFGDWGVLALVLDFREVMLTSPPELAHCAPPPQKMDPTKKMFGPHEKKLKLKKKIKK